jgi:hypothetical protein
MLTTSFHTGQTPTDWKTANVAPAFKKGEKHKAICCKLMEHIVTKYHSSLVCREVCGGGLYRKPLQNP